MQVAGIVAVIFTVSLQVYAETEHEEEELRKVFDFLKRKYSHEIPDRNMAVRADPVVVNDIHVPPVNPTVAELLEPVTVHVPTPDPVTGASTRPHDERVVQKQVTHPEKAGFEPTAKPLKKEFHKLNRLPGCDFLLNILHEAPAAPINNDIIDYFDQYNDFYAEGLVMDLKPVLQYSEDYDAVALLATRKVTKLIFLERLRCPATKFDIITVQQMLRELTKLIKDEDDSMYDFLATMLVELPNMAYSGYDPNYLAHEMTRLVHGQLFNDTIDYLLGTSMQDVEDFSRSFYERLRQQLPFLVTLGDTMMNADLKHMVHNNILWANVHCPSTNDVNRRHLKAAWDMTNWLKEIETYELCMEIENYLEQFVSRPTYASASEVKNYDNVMKNICGYVREYVQTIMTREQEYQKMVAARDPLALQEFFQHYLSEDELTILAEVLEKLHWTPNFPVTDKPRTPENTSGEVLPKKHVISNELQDIDFWKSYLEALTLEKFEQMDLTDFKESIRRWLKEKQNRIENYYNFENKNTQSEKQNASAQNEGQAATAESED